MVFSILLTMVLVILFIVWKIDSIEDQLIPSLKNAYPYSVIHRHNKPSGAFSPTLLILVALLTIVVFTQVFIKNNVGVKETFLGNSHLETNTVSTGLGTLPATSGAHFEALLPWKVYDETLPDEMLLHNMEEGGVVLWYRLGNKAENAQRQAALKNIASAFPNTIIVPRDNLQTTYMLTAWQRRMSFDESEFEDKKILDFLKAYSSKQSLKSHTSVGHV